MGAKRKRTAKTKSAAKKAKTGAKPSLEETLRTLGTRPLKGKKRGATSFQKLEKFTPIPDSLRALWAWSNGCANLLCRSKEFQIFDDLFSVETAAEELKVNREEAGMESNLIPFGGEEGSGDCLVLDTTSGRVFFWDHEEGSIDADPVAQSLEELLARALS